MIKDNAKTSQALQEHTKAQILFISHTETMPFLLNPLISSTFLSISSQSQNSEVLQTLLLNT